MRCAPLCSPQRWFGGGRALPLPPKVDGTKVSEGKEPSRDNVLVVGGSCLGPGTYSLVVVCVRGGGGPPLFIDRSPNRWETLVPRLRGDRSKGAAGYNQCVVPCLLINIVSVHQEWGRKSTFLWWKVKELHCPLPQGSEAVYTRSSAAHCPEIVKQ